MKRLMLIGGNFLAWILLCQPALCQQSGSAAPAGTVGGASSPNSSPSGIPTGSTSPTATGSANTNSPGNPSAANPPTPNGQSLDGAQPGQTGTVESQRNNAINQAYRDRQQRAEANAQERFNQQQPPSELNQLAPGAQRQNVGAFGANDSALRNPGANRQGFSRQTYLGTPGYRVGINQPFDRSFIVNDLRHHGQQADDWRVVDRGGRWWFWTPGESWMYYDNGEWVAYSPSDVGRRRMAERRDVSIPIGYPAEDWRLVFHNGRWWFWTPNNTWMYFHRGRWSDLGNRGPIASQARSTERFGVGYRGVADVDNAQEPAARTDSDTDDGNRSTQSQPQPQNNPITDPLNNPSASSTNPTISPIQPESSTELESNPIKAQDEAGMNIDAQN